LTRRLGQSSGLEFGNRLIESVDSKLRLASSRAFLVGGRVFLAREKLLVILDKGLGERGIYYLCSISPWKKPNTDGEIRSASRGKEE
jgi:hypothetical protein